MSTQKAYLIPENYLPAGYRCLKVFVPDDDLYIAEFWNQYERFTFWNLWEQDALKRGRQVAFKWRTAFEMARALFEQFGGCEMAITNIRQNPANPCDVQVQFDGSTTWQSIIDISKCNSGGSGGLSGLSNLTIQNNVIVGTDQCGDVVPLGPVIDPKHNTAVTPAYPSAPPDGACIAAANAAQTLEDQIHQYGTARTTIIGYWQQALNLLQGFLVLIPEVDWMAALAEILDEVGEFAEDHDADLVTMERTDVTAPIFAAYYSPDGTMSPANWQALLDELALSLPTPPTWTAEQDYDFMVYRYIKAMGSSGMSRLANSAGITTADCSGAHWTVTFDFASGQNGWISSRPDGIQTAQYVQYSYWKQVTALYGGVYQTGAQIYRRGLAPFTLTGISFTYDAVPGEFPGFGPEAFAQVHNSGGDHVFSQEYITEAVTNRVLADTAVWNDVDSVEIFVHSGSDATLPVANGGTAKIKRVTITGTGLNPFA